MQMNYCENNEIIIKTLLMFVRGERKFDNFYKICKGGSGCFIYAFMLILSIYHKHGDNVVQFGQQICIFVCAFNPVALIIIH